MDPQLVEFTAVEPTDTEGRLITGEINQGSEEYVT